MSPRQLFSGKKSDMIMTVRIPWDRYEVALLFSAYERVADGADISQEAARLSETLRALAIRRGASIDGTYRNTNGIKMQLANVQYLFSEGQKGLSGASTMIRQMYELYKANQAEYQIILEEAIRLTSLNTSIEDAFCAYAKERVGLSPRILAEYLRKAADYCHLKQPLLGMTDIKAVRNVQQKVAEGKLLRFRYGKDAQTIRNVTRLYYIFIKSYREPNVEPPIQKTPAEGKTIPTKPTLVVDAMGVESALGPQTAVLTETSEDDASESNVAVLHEDVTEERSDDLLWVDFSQDNPYLFTKPVAYTYKGVLHDAKSWNRLYAEVCSLLFADYRESFMGIMNGDIPEYSALAFADEQNYSWMRMPRAFAPGFYLESNMDATSIVRRIRGLYQLFNLGEHLQISYRKTENRVSMFPEKPDTGEWIIGQLKARGLTYQDKRTREGCLWIVGGHELDTFVQECKGKGYMLTFKANGCKTFPTQPVWWTKNFVEQKIDTSDFRRRLDDGFKLFLVSDKRLAERTAAQYSQSIEAVERFLLENGMDCTLDIDDPDEAQRIYNTLMVRDNFVAWNNQRHYQYSAALAQYVAYLRQDGPDADELEFSNRGAIKDAVVTVLHDAGMPLTVPEITQRIESQQLYKFNSSNPSIIVYSGIRRHCKGMKSRHHGPVDVFDRFTDANGQFRYILIGEGEIPDGNKGGHEFPEADERWMSILQDSFPDGYILNDFLSQFQAAGFWQDRYGDVCPIEGDAIDGAMKAIGTERDGRVFMRSEEDSQLISAICAEIVDILSRYTTVYRTCIYDRYQDQLASCQIYTEQVMSQQLLAAAGGSFYSINQVFAKPGQYASVIQDCSKVLRDHGGPMPVSDVAKVLWFIPYDMVYHYLSVDDEALNIGSSTWMLVEHFPLTREDAQKIGDMLSEYLLASDYVHAVDLMPVLQKRLPSIADNLTGMTYMAVFNIVAYYLRDRFSFSKAIISPRGTSVDFTDLFKAFASEHETFTLADLESFSSELKLPIYWESTYAGGAVRVSKTDFVNRNLIHFDVDAVDQVLEDFCPGDYLPIQAVSSAMMMHLPSCGYRWNGYLLLSYVQGFSKAFRLSYNSLGKTGFYGAMVRRSCKEIGNYSSLIERVLTDDDTWTTSADALDLLVKRGYQVLRKYKGIENVVEKARQNKQADGR